MLDREEGMEGARSYDDLSRSSRKHHHQLLRVLGMGRAYRLMANLAAVEGLANNGT